MVGGLGLVGVLGGCTSAAYTSSGDALSDLMNPKLNYRVRAAAVGPSRDAAKSNPSLTAATDSALERIAWNPLEHETLRSAAIRELLEAGGATAAAAKERARVALARERSIEVIGVICDEASARGWTEFVPSMIRSLSRGIKGVEEKDRAERVALRKLAPGKDAAQTAFEVFVNNPAAPSGASATWNAEQRADAWDVLDREDPDGTRRRAWVYGLQPRPDDAVLSALGASVRELRMLPRTSKELEWLLAIRKDAGVDAWWGEVSSAVAKIADDERLELRHAESLRWATAKHPEWVASTRAGLLATLKARLEGREHFARTADSSDRRPKDRLEQVEARLGWADLVQILVIDELLSDVTLFNALVQQAGLDRKDSTTEYGGVLEAGGSGPRAVLYMPRGSERPGDNRFVASPEMIAASRFGLAHYHFHVQEWRNQDYAGPSEQDLDYSHRYGRACVVLTGIREGSLGADYYDPNGVVVDLGTRPLRSR